MHLCKSTTIIPAVDVCSLAAGTRRYIPCGIYTSHIVLVLTPCSSTHIIVVAMILTLRVQAPLQSWFGSLIMNVLQFFYLVIHGPGNLCAN